MTIWRRERAGTFPRRVRIGVNSIAFIEEEIYRWQNARAAERTASADDGATDSATTQGKAPPC
jgi:hypothetical protein